MEKVTAEMWKDFVRHVIKEEEKFYQWSSLMKKLDQSEPTASHIVLTITGDTTDSESDNE